MTNYDMNDHLYDVSDCARMFAVFISIERNLFSVAFKPYTTSLKFPGAPTTTSITILYAQDNIDNKYNEVLHMY